MSSKAADFMWGVVLFVVCGATVATIVLLAMGCTPGQQAAVTQHTVTGAKIAACVQGVLAEEDRERQRLHREAELAAEEEAQRLRDEEIERITRDGGTSQ